MTDDRFTDAQVREGRVLLAHMMTRPTVEEMPPACPPFAYMCAANLDALVIHERDGGWVVDLLFRNVPEGCPDIIGTRDARPYDSFGDALFAGFVNVNGFRLAPSAQDRGPAHKVLAHR